MNSEVGNLARSARRPVPAPPLALEAKAIAEEAAAVHVRFDGDDDGEGFEYYFGEEELAVVARPASAAAAAAIAAASSAAAARAAELEPLLAAEPRRDVAIALVAPLLAYKISAMANGQKLMASLDATIVIAGFAAVYYCLPN